MKNSSITLLFLIVGYTNFLAANNPHQIRKDLQEKYAQGLIDKYELAEENIRLQEVLDRDIQIMQDYKKYLESKISWPKGIYARKIVPFFKGTFALMTASLSITSSVIAYGGNLWIKNKWEGKDNIVGMGADNIVKIGKSWGFFADKDVEEYNKKKLEELRKAHPEFDHMVMTSSIAGAVSFLSGLLFIKLITSLYTYHARLDASIAKWQQKKKDCNAIIGQLKRLKYSL